MAKYSGKAELIPDDGGVPIEVSIFLRRGKHGHLTTWSGQAFPSGDQMLTVTSGSQYTVRLLPSGSEGTLLVRNVAMKASIDGEFGQRLDVVGSGPPPF